MSILREQTLERKVPGNVIAQYEINESAQQFPQAWTRPIPGEEVTTPDYVYQASLRLVEAGLSVIPIEAYEGSKSPDSMRLPHPRDSRTGQSKPSWSIYKMRRPNVDELKRWRESMDGPYGLAVIGGTVSGGQHGLGLEVIDLDTAELTEPWAKAVEQKAPGLVNRLVRVLTPRPGLHTYYRCSRYGASQKLAFTTAKDEFDHAALDSFGRPIRKTLIEVKAEGGYCLIPPSPARCHPTGRLYEYAAGSPDLCSIPTITPEERSILWNAARSLNQWHEVKPEPKRVSQGKSNYDLALPGHDFNARGHWADILMKHGWTFAGKYGEETRWCRPGKSSGVSATTNHGGCDLLHVFSANADPFEQDRGYSKFAAYALLNHGGNFQAAARDLRKEGFGQQNLKPGKR